MQKLINIFLFFLVLIFLGSTYNYYSSNKITEIKDYNRSNIEEIINKNISNLPILDNDTNDVIEFNDGFSGKVENDKPRSFWNLLKPE